VIPIVAHPERYQNIIDNFSLLAEWKRNGAFLQLNAGSIAGAYGSRAEKVAWRCLEVGAVDYLSSDFHARGKCLVSEAEGRIAARGGRSQFKVLTGLNGVRLLAGIEPTPVPPLDRPKSGWRRLTNAILGKRSGDPTYWG
jgi:protein-tyrosine phosphatase